ncbi:probable E3 SUMO-protein ligase RNF212 isoform X2 [Centruroides sculpturatus]|nr:probable E3 SUMO-protein ligase RNF212 isoform X2 [Centruroides sculpturatus]
MTDWVHCNTCFSLLGSGKRFLLTSCGHIYCNDCATGSQMNCQICGNSCTTIHLTTQMKPDVEIYFMDPQDLLKKYMKQLQQIINFQTGHRMRLSAYFRKEFLTSNILLIGNLMCFYNMPYNNSFFYLNS